MKIKILLVIVFLMSTLSAFAQDTLREGNLIYVIDINGVTQSLESTRIKEESYVEAHLTFSSETDLRKMYQKIFSKERAAELSDYVLICLVQFNAISQRISHVVFSPLDNKMRLTLTELKRLEIGLKSLKYNYWIVNNTKVDQFSLFTVPIKFRRIYDDQYWKQRE